GGSGIEVTGSRGERVIVLPRVPFDPAALFIVLFGAVFAGVAIIALAAVFGDLPIKVSGSRIGLGIIASLFVVIGVAIAALPILGAWAGEGVGGGGDAIAFSTRLLGRRAGVTRIPRRDIKEVDLREDVLAHRTGGGATEEVFVLSDHAIARIGRDLTPDG